MKFCAHQEHTKMSSSSTQKFLDKNYPIVAYRITESQNHRITEW